MTSKTPSRRDFILSSAAGAAALATGLRTVSAGAFVQGSDEIRVGLIGCGGRGTGAAKDAVEAASGVRVVSMGDIFQDQLDVSRGVLEKLGSDKFTAEAKDCFVGFDAYQKVIHHPQVNYVILATPPGFRPQHFRETIEAGQPCFFEKPVAVDSTGVRSILETGKLADEKKLSVVTGTIYRRADNFTQAVEYIKSGKIGKATAGFAYYMAGPAWVKLAEDGAGRMEQQCRNWPHYPWLAGDHIVEQSVHNIDVLHWMFGPAKSAYATGGKIALTDTEIYGPSYDHFSVEYVFEGDVRVQFTSRKIAETDTRVANRIICEGGVIDADPGSLVIRDHSGKELVNMKAKDAFPYVGEHRDLINAIRERKHINESRQIAESTLMAIMGRESAYSGRLVEWDWALNQSQQQLGPKGINDTDPIAGGINFETTPPEMDVPVPGVYKLA
jgi:predicted dehydrogenase